MCAAPRRARRQRAQAEGPARPAATFPHTCLEVTDSYKIRVTRVKSGMRGPHTCRTATRVPRAGPPHRPLQTLLQEAHETRSHEAGIAPGLLDRIAEPVMRRPLHDAGADEKVRLLQPQQECIGMRPPVDEIV